MLYLEAIRISNKIGVSQTYIIHRESDSLMNYTKKYYRYGKCNYYVFSKIKSYADLANPRIKKENKLNSFNNSSCKIKILFLMRSLSFILGYLIGKIESTE